MTGPTDLAESVSDPAAHMVDDMQGQEKVNHIPSPTQGRPTPGEPAAAPPKQAKPAPANSPTTPGNANREPGIAEEIRSSVKETVRPLHNQLAESGAVEAWKEVKTDLGLDKSKWDEEGANAGNPKTHGPPDGPNATRWQESDNRPKTEAQAQIDRELASHMLEKLIDEVKPWAISLLALYLLGYLIKAGLGHSQRRSIRRQERETKRILRRASRKASNTKPDA